MIDLEREAGKWVEKKEYLFDVRHDKWIDTEKETKHTENWIFKSALSQKKMTSQRVLARQTDFH